MSYLFATNMCIALLKGRERTLVDNLKSHSSSDFALCSVVKAELLYGARHSERVEENLQLLEQFFAQFASYPFDDHAASYYGTIRALLAAGGTPIGANDLLIAAIALAHDAVVLTRNRREFERVPGLRIECW